MYYSLILLMEWNLNLKFKNLFAYSKNIGATILALYLVSK